MLEKFPELLVSNDLLAGPVSLHERGRDKGGQRQKIRGEVELCRRHGVCGRNVPIVQKCLQPDDGIEGARHHLRKLGRRMQRTELDQVFNRPGKQL